MPFADITFAGVTFRMDTLGGADQSARDMITGTFEAPLPAVLMATLARFEGAFIDVGANSGVYAIMAGAKFPGREIVCFEPAPGPLAVLKRNSDENRLSNTMIIHNLALSDENVLTNLYFPRDNFNLLDTSPTLEPDFHSSFTTVEARTQRLDDFNDLPRNISAMKVDVEGHEHRCLTGCRATIARARPVVFCEVLHIAKFDQLEALFRDLAYLNIRLRPDLAVYEKHVTFDPLAWNHAFVPGEKIQAFKEIIEGCGLTLV